MPKSIALQSQAARIEPLQRVIVTHEDYLETFDMLVRHYQHRFTGGHHYIDLVLDENIDRRFGEKLPLLS